MRRGIGLERSASPVQVLVELGPVLAPVVEEVVVLGSADGVAAGADAALGTETAAAVGRGVQGMLLLFVFGASSAASTDSSVLSVVAGVNGRELR